MTIRMHVRLFQNILIFKYQVVKFYFYDISVKVDTVGRIDGLQSSLLLKEFGLFLV